MKPTLLILVSILFLSCNIPQHKAKNYQNALKVIKQHYNLIELTTNNGASRIAIAPEIQGKILTSSYNGLDGNSNGWLNLEIFNNAPYNIAAIGGEERLWLGPLGGQYSFYYQNIKPLNENNWKVPNPIGLDGYQLINKSETFVNMQKHMIINNHIDTKFNLLVKRKISILDDSQIKKNLSIQFNKSLKRVAYKTEQSLINTGTNTLKKETGLVSLWSAGMFKGSNKTVVIIPLKDTTITNLYQYMGSLDSTRLYINKNNVLLFKADGKYRSKIGVPKHLAPKIYGCYAKDLNRLTIVQYLQTNDSLYANSHAKVQEHPYKGEVIPIYNNGTMDYSPALETSFYELESTSAMRELKPNIDTLKHWQSVYHFSGKDVELNKIALKLLNIDLKDCSL
ncbi:hypothetical protein GCM10022291_21260 [Postechiella marina]|uniref:Lipoprotein n=1 Tax=Postechiella marina TaxID=943941 RepID=A0ABP8CAI6_9FLAO